MLHIVDIPPSWLKRVKSGQRTETLIFLLDADVAHVHLAVAPMVCEFDNMSSHPPLQWLGIGLNCRAGVSSTGAGIVVVAAVVVVVRYPPIEAVVSTLLASKISAETTGVQHQLLVVVSGC
jgi:hypothetical protein